MKGQSLILRGHIRSCKWLAKKHHCKESYTNSTAVSNVCRGGSLLEILGSYTVRYPCAASTDKNWHHVEETIHKAQERSGISSIPSACSMSGCAHGQAKAIPVPKPLCIVLKSTVQKVHIFSLPVLPLSLSLFSCSAEGSTQGPTNAK